MRKMLQQILLMGLWVPLKKENSETHFFCPVLCFYHENTSVRRRVSLTNLQNHFILSLIIYPTELFAKGSNNLKNFEEKPFLQLSNFDCSNWL